MNRRFWLVQRHAIDSDLGFDGFFRFDYMGASEFEYGAPHRALQSMRSHSLEVYPFALNGKTLHVIADPKTVHERIDELLDWMTDPHHRKRTAERTYFPEQVYDTADDYMLDTVAWWSFDDDMAWTLDSHIANLLHTAFNTKVNQRG